MLLKVYPEQWLWLIICILCVWRLTTLICYEAGPFNLISKMRAVCYRFRLGKLIDCFHCASVWISIIITLCVYVVNSTTFFLVLAIAGGASIIEKSLNHGAITEEENDVHD